MRIAATLAFSATLASLAISVVVLGVACSGGEEPPRRGDELDCVWIADPQNCWREVVASVDLCLGNAGMPPIGELSADGLSCTYPGGRTITATKPLDRPGQGELDAAVVERDFHATSASGESCLRFVQAGSAVELTAPSGTLRFSASNGTVQLTCPDGRTFSGPTSALFGCLSPAAAPGYSWLNTDASATFALNGMVGPVYACRRPAADAGSD